MKRKSEINGRKEICLDNQKNGIISPSGKEEGEEREGAGKEG